MLLVRGALVVTMDPVGTLHRDSAVLIEGQRIRAVGSADELRREPGITRTLGGDDYLVMSGLVNAQGRMDTLDAPTLLAEARAAAGRLASRAGLASLTA